MPHHTNRPNPSEYEIVITLHDYDDETPFKLIKNNELQEALEYLKQWHYPGEHDTDTRISKSKNDESYTDNEGYVMVYNLGLGDITLYFKPTTKNHIISGWNDEYLLNGYNDDDTFKDEEESNIIFSYTRKDALADGQQILVDKKTSKDAGINFPVFVTSSVLGLFEHLDFEGVLWDILNMFRWAVMSQKGDSDTIKFQVKIGRENHTLYAQVGAYDVDNPEPAITIMLPIDM